VGKDRKTGKWWCSKCKEVKETYVEMYRIVVIGKNTGKDIGLNNFAKCIAREWKLMGHDVIEVHSDVINECVEIYNMEECFRFKKPIDLRLIEYRYDPDFIFIEQLYNRFDTSNVKCPVIYQHREYTHFPDVEYPDMILGSYPFRVHIFEQYNPWGCHLCRFRADNFVAVYPPFFPPNENKVLKGISYMGWGAPPQHFIDANGPIAKMVIEDQLEFMEQCRKKGMNFVKGQGGHEHYKERLGSMEAVVVDGGYLNCFGRTMFEAMAMKTLCIVRVHHKKAEEIYKKMGLTEDMCYFIHEPNDIAILLKDWDDEVNVAIREEKVRKAYEWVMKNHTYEVRARETLDMFEEWKNGGERIPYFMGYARRLKMELKDGMLEIEQG
jgi:hypothetical protein